MAGRIDPASSRTNRLAVQGHALPWDWFNLGAAFGGKPNSQCLAARCNFTVRRGFDLADGSDYGRVVEGLGDMGVNLRSRQYVFGLSASNLAYKAGADAPAQAASLLGNTLAAVKLTFAQEYGEDAYAAVSWDVKQRKPELSLAWAGETFSERALLLLRADPVDRALRLGAAVSFPGPEWRKDVLNSEGLVETPVETGARHSLFVEHEMRPGTLLSGATVAGAKLDLGRLVNYAADYVDYELEDYIPGALWRIPFMGRLYGLLVPPEDAEQERHHIRGWTLDLQHNFAAGASSVGLTKQLRGRKASLSAQYSLAARSASLYANVQGVVAGVTLARADGGDWSKPALMLNIQPLAFL